MKISREQLKKKRKTNSIQQYKEGKLSLERTAKELQTSISELFDILAEFGIETPIEYEDYLEGLKNL